MSRTPSHIEVPKEDTDGQMLTMTPAERARYERHRLERQEFIKEIADEMASRFGPNGCGNSPCQFSPEAVSTLNDFAKEYRDSRAFRRWVTRAVVATVLAAGFLWICGMVWSGLQHSIKGS